jgi:hypothetical protein
MSFRLATSPGIPAPSQGVLSTARDEHVMHTFLDKTFCRSEAHMGRSAGYDRNLICNPLLSLAVCPGFSLDEKLGGEVVSNVLLIIASV